MINSYLKYLIEDRKSSDEIKIANRNPKGALLVAQSYHTVRPYINDICKTMDNILNISLHKIPNSRLDDKKFDPKNMKKPEKSWSEGYKVIHGPGLYSTNDNPINKKIILRNITSAVNRINSKWEIVQYERLIENIGMKGRFDKDNLLCYIKPYSSKLFPKISGTILAFLSIDTMNSNIDSHVYHFNLHIQVFGLNT